MPQPGSKRLSAMLAMAACLAMAPALAQTSAPAAADPVVAKVNGQDIRLSDVTDAMQQLPAEMRGMPPAMLFPLMVDQVIDRAAIVDLARKRGLERDPAVARQMVRAQDQALQTALISRDVGPLVSEAAVRARYDREIAGKPGEEEVHARHILVATEAEAKQVIADLKKGGDFAAIAKARSSDRGSSQDGDLGFFKKGDMVPEFAAAAFALKPGQISEVPVKTQFGWHVIKVEARRTAPPPAFEQAYDELRQKMIQEGVEKVLKEARTGITVEKFNMDGSPQRATDAAEPPPAPPKK